MFSGFSGNMGKNQGTEASEKSWSKTYAKQPSNFFLQYFLMKIVLIPMLIEEYQINLLTS